MFVLYRKYVKIQNLKLYVILMKKDRNLICTSRIKIGLSWDRKKYKLQFCFIDIVEEEQICSGYTNEEFS